jgi:starch-binding outer membrane protein, SusD/RagB family
MLNRMKAPAAMLAAVVALTGCDLLEVGNPNNLVEESIRNEAAASAVVNGSLSLVSSSISQTWQPYLVASDEMYWIGSRDAWGSLDAGFVDDPLNEFIDGPYPAMGQARWHSDLAIDILTGHLAENNSTAMQSDLARANLFSGLMYMVIGETQEDVTFSDKTEDGPALGPANMFQVLDGAISRFDAAVSGANAVGDADIAMKAMAARARAKQSRAIWDAINPSPSGSGMVNAASAASDANAVITAAGGVTADWLYNLTYSSGTVGNSMASWVNDRKENQIDLSIVTVNAANDIDGIALMDPIDNVGSPAVIKFLNQWKGGNYLDKGGVYEPLTVSSTRLMHLILAENALASGDAGTFTTHINHIRAMDGSTAFSGQIANQDMLEHTRRVNVLMQGLRLADMYRFGATSSDWSGLSAAAARPGEMLPISIIEVRANCNLNGLGC